jgi:carbonic anhydrase/acetyltransferase-like protein (isoleucine patch superfamily)
VRTFFGEGSRKGKGRPFSAEDTGEHRGKLGLRGGSYAETRSRGIFKFLPKYDSITMIRSYKGVQPVIPATCYVDDSAQIIGDVVLGEHASVWMNAVVRGDVHEIRIGAHSNVQDNSVLHGMKQQWGVYLGEYVTVGHTVTLHGCVIEDRCLIGMGSIILNGAKIGAGSIIAAGTLIPEGTVVEPRSLWMGSPGKFRRKLEAADQESIMRYARNYLGYKDEYLKER